MAKLVYFAMASLDGYVEDVAGSFDWAAPDEEVHAYANQMAGRFGTYLYGRRMYETMRYWETVPAVGDQPAVAVEFGEIWRRADKIVYSTSLEGVTTARTRLERSFDPDAVRRLKGRADADMSVGGAELAGQAMAAGLVDELHLVYHPVIVGGGKRALPSELRLRLELVNLQRFGAGAVHLHYRCRS